MSDHTAERAPWRLTDEEQWEPLEDGGATNRIAMPADPRDCYGCGLAEDDDVTFGVMIRMHHVETSARWTLFLCDDCWSSAATETRLSDLWATIPEP